MLSLLIHTHARTGYWAFTNATDKLGGKSTKKSRKGDGKAATFDEDDWIKGTPHAALEKKRKAAAAASKKE